MNWQRLKLRKQFLIPTLFLFLTLFLVSTVEASPYYITHPTYFPSKSGSYITFDTSLLPLSFNTLYRDTQTRWHIDSYWIRTDADMTVTKWFTNDHFIATVSKPSGTSTVELGGVDEPSRVLIDGSKVPIWSFNDVAGTVTVTVDHASSHEVFMDWNPIETPAGQAKEEEIPNGPIVPPLVPPSPVVPWKLIRSLLIVGILGVVLVWLLTRRR